MTTIKRKNTKYEGINMKNLEERNKAIRARFEKEAHDREREEIDAYVEGYNKWRDGLIIKRMM